MWNEILSKNVSKNVNQNVSKNVNQKNTSFLRSGNDIKFLIDYQETFQEMVNAIRTAKYDSHYIAGFRPRATTFENI